MQTNLYWQKVIALGWKGKGQGDQQQVWENAYVIILIVLIVAQTYTYTQTYQIVDFIYVQSILPQLHLNNNVKNTWIRNNKPPSLFPTQKKSL